MVAEFLYEVLHSFADAAFNGLPGGSRYVRHDSLEGASRRPVAPVPDAVVDASTWSRPVVLPVSVSWGLGTDTIEITTPTGIVVPSHRLAPGVQGRWSAAPGGGPRW